MSRDSDVKDKTMGNSIKDMGSNTRTLSTCSPMTSTKGIEIGITNTIINIMRNIKIKKITVRDYLNRIPIILFPIIIIQIHPRI